MQLRYFCFRKASNCEDCEKVGGYKHGVWRHFSFLMVCLFALVVWQYDCWCLCTRLHLFLAVPRATGVSHLSFSSGFEREDKQHSSHVSWSMFCYLFCQPCPCVHCCTSCDLWIAFPAPGESKNSNCIQSQVRAAWKSRQRVTAWSKSAPAAFNLSALPIICGRPVKATRICTSNPFNGLQSEATASTNDYWIKRPGCLSLGVLETFPKRDVTGKSRGPFSSQNCRCSPNREPGPLPPGRARAAQSPAPPGRDPPPANRSAQAQPLAHSRAGAGGGEDGRWRRRRPHPERGGGLPASAQKPVSRPSWARPRRRGRGFRASRAACITGGEGSAPASPAGSQQPARRAI